METRVASSGGGIRFPRLGLLGGTNGPLVGLLLLCVIFSFASDYFLSVRTALNILDQVTVLGILAIGMTAVIITGGIDLSVGSVLAFSMMMTGWLSHQVGVPLGLAIPLGIAAGAACGLVSGLLITRARLPAFIATLTMMSVARGLANILTEGRQVVGYPDWFTSLAVVRHFGFLSATVALFILLTVLASPASASRGSRWRSTRRPARSRASPPWRSPRGSTPPSPAPGSATSSTRSRPSSSAGRA
jgi:ribose transport system permease protein